MDLSKLSNEELLKLKAKFAGEVSKKTCSDSIGESRVQVSNPAPIKIERKEEIYNFYKEEFITEKIESKIAYEWLLYKHYAHRIPHIMYSYGLFTDKKLSGVCTFGIPASSFSFELQPLELNRLVVNDGLPKNTLSYFVNQSLKSLPQNTIVVSYADPNQNHHGYIYQATNWIFTGKGSAESTYKVNGEIVHRKNIYNRYGTSSVPELEKRGFKIEKIPQEGKYRYFYLIGNHKFKKIWKAELNSKYGIYPYPKGDNSNYDASYEIKGLEVNRKGQIK